MGVMRRKVWRDLVILLLLLGFMFYQKIDIKITGEIIIPDSHCNFYPFAFHIANSAEEMRPYHLFTDATFTEKDAEELVSTLDFSNHTYLITYGAPIESAFYSLKTTLFDDISPLWAKAFREGKHLAIIEYGVADNRQHVYVLKKTNRLGSGGGG